LKVRHRSLRTPLEFSSAGIGQYFRLPTLIERQLDGCQDVYEWGVRQLAPAGFRHPQLLGPTVTGHGLKRNRILPTKPAWLGVQPSAHRRKSVRGRRGSYEWPDSIRKG
jgi:hypothetical protein